MNIIQKFKETASSVLPVMIIVLVLGVTDANVRLITEIDDPETVEEIRASEPVVGGVFQEQFGSLSDFVQKIPPLFRK